MFEKRRFYRLKSPIQVRFRIISGDNKGGASRLIKGKTENISMGGICLETNLVQVDGLHISHDSSMLYKNRLEMEIDLSPDMESVKAIGEVIWYDLKQKKGQYIYNVGVWFLEISEEDKNKLSTFLSQ
ncbi:MAG: PilZ domain-containing protein [Nitrospinae bacterium]|nr:PilZ domain-containing protein [Nitrospinota bacterium]